MRSEKSYLLDRQMIMVALLALLHMPMTNYEVVIALNKKVCNFRKY